MIYDFLAAAYTSVFKLPIFSNFVGPEIYVYMDILLQQKSACMNIFKANKTIVHVKKFFGRFGAHKVRYIRFL